MFFLFITSSFTSALSLLALTLFLANLSMFSVGSEPIDSRHTIGVWLLLSANMVSKSRTVPSAYCWPRESEM